MQNSSSSLPGIFAAERHQAVMREAEIFAERSQMLFNQIRAEAVVAGGHRRVRGEDDFAGDAVDGVVEIQAFFLHAIANRFEHRESAMAFVEMQHARRDAHRFQRAEAADAEQQFLADADARIAAVEARGKFHVLRRVSFDVRIEQQQIAAAHFHAPDLGVDHSAARFDLHGDGLTVRADGQLHRQVIDVGR